MRSGAPTPWRMQSAGALFIFRSLKASLTTADALGLTNSAKRSLGFWKA